MACLCALPALSDITKHMTDTSFRVAMLEMVGRHGSLMGIINAHNCATDPDEKQRLKVAGLYVSYVQLEGKVPDADRGLLRQKVTDEWAKITQS